MPYPTVDHAQRLNQWHTAANLIDKAYNPREPLHHTLARTHTREHTLTAPGRCHIRPAGLGTGLQANTDSK